MLDYTLFSIKLFNLFYYFIIYAFIGWGMESIYATSKKGRFVNRGFLNGPFCPIYGFGVLILIIVLSPILNNLLLLFIGAMFLTSALEYITGFVLEKAFNSTWWDYSNQPFNIQGRICLRFSVYWGMLSVFVLNILHPKISKLVSNIPYNYGIIILYVMFVYFIVDYSITLHSVIKLNSLLEQMHKLSFEVKEKLELIKGTAVGKVEDIEGRIEELKIKYEELLSKRIQQHQRLINAFPNLSSKSFNHILKDIKNKIESDIKLRISK